MASLTAFGAPFSWPERVLRRWSRVLSGYWQIGRWLYSVLLAGVIIPALAQGPADLLHYPTVRTLVRFWPATVPVVLAIGASLVVAWTASRNRAYYDLLDQSADNYRQTRQGYRAIAAQLPAQLPARRAPGQSAWPDGGPAADGFDVFDQRLYTERSEAAAVYEEFVQQTAKRILLIVGDGGSGKSTFLLHRMAGLSGTLPSDARPHPCAFVNCKLDSLSHASELTVIVSRKLGQDMPTILREGVRGRHDRALVVLVDAINENVAPSRDDINIHLTQFAEDYLSRPESHVYLCVSVRKAYWDELRRRFAGNPTSATFGWLNYVYLPQSRSVSAPTAETASVLLGNFGEAEFGKAYQSYREIYRIEGQIADERTRSICANPLLLQVFCISFHDQDIRDLESVRNLVRELDIFDAYARGALARIAEQIGIPADEPNVHGETLVERSVRGLLLELALGMVERGRPFLTDTEVLHLARTRAREALRLGGLRVQGTDDLYREGSALRAIISEGIVLERSRMDISGRAGEGGIRFVSERYLEYSIGRGLVRRWRLEEMSREAILADFSDLMSRHIRLRAAGFDNLRLGLAIAALVAEQSAAQLPDGLYLDLLQTLAKDAEFDWNQMACRVLQQLRVLNRSAHSGPEPGPEADDLLAVLDGLAEKNDFVLRWDIERALVHAVDAGEGQAVLRHLREWMRPSAAFAQQLFGGESLGYLFKQRADYRKEVVAVLEGIVTSLAGLDFWLLRSLMFSVTTMMEALAADNGPQQATQPLREYLGLVPWELLGFARLWWDRSVVLASQIERGVAADPERWIEWDWAAESGWTAVNAALAAERACAGGQCTARTVAVLASIWRSRAGYNPHLSWAVWHVLGPAAAAAATGGPSSAEAAGLRAEIEEQARRQLAADPRAAWVLQAALPPAELVPAEVTTPAVVVYHPEYSHTDLHNHPESKERVQAILDHLEESPPAAGPDGRPLLTYVSPYRFTAWDDDQRFLLLAHEAGWIRRVQELSQELAEAGKPDIMLESDVEVRAGSYEGAVLAVRGTVCAVDLVTSSPGPRLAIALVRPPGHLAGNKICIFNNVAVAAKYGQQVLAPRTGRRPHVLIVDCDAHHGKSTQDIFYENDSVLYFSTHQAGVHPGTGRFDERGRGKGLGYTVNVPVPAGSGDRVQSEVLRRALRVILDGFAPELILVSLGLDAYYADEFSQLQLTSQSFAEVAAVLRGYQGGRPGTGIVASLEGGYDLNSMGWCVRRFLGGLCDPAGQEPAGPAESPAISALDRYLLAQDAGQPVPDLLPGQQQWLSDFAELEADLREQWPA